MEPLKKFSLSKQSRKLYVFYCSTKHCFFCKDFLALFLKLLKKPSSILHFTPLVYTFDAALHCNAPEVHEVHKLYYKTKFYNLFMSFVPKVTFYAEAKATFFEKFKPLKIIWSLKKCFSGLHHHALIKTFVVTLFSLFFFLNKAQNLR